MMNFSLESISTEDTDEHKRAAAVAERVPGARSVRQGSLKMSNRTLRVTWMLAKLESGIGTAALQ